MARRSRAVAWVGVPGGLVLAAIIGAGPAGADVVTPPGACFGSGTWESTGQTETSPDHVPSDVIAIPQQDTVAWTGQVGDGTGSERREIGGEIRVQLPIGSVVVDDWGGESERYANEGEHTYELPSAVIGIEMTLSGTHSEGGSEVCSGSVGMVVEGGLFDNPLAAGAVGGLVVSGAGLAFAAKGKP
jgi:hypothetical protein